MWVYVIDCGVFGKIVKYEDDMATVVLFDSHIAYELHLDPDEYIDSEKMIRKTFDIDEAGMEL